MLLQGQQMSAVSGKNMTCLAWVKDLEGAFLSMPSEEGCGIVSCFHLRLCPTLLKRIEWPGNNKTTQV